jgi:osmoprotectant transport system permease protein
MMSDRTEAMLRAIALALAIVCGLVFGLLAGHAAAAEDTLRIGSKRFTESYVLAEILVRTASPHTAAQHLPGMGNTAILFEALRQGSIDLYPEYLGTIELEILRRPGATGSLEAVNEALAPLGLAASIPFGFNNTYALAVRAETAARLGLAPIGSLAAHPQLRLGLSHEFLGRADGWAGLKARYKLPQQPSGLDHGLAYEALAAGTIDVIDIYSTDAKVGKYGLTVLSDELGYFPRYDAVVLHRLDVPERFPRAWEALGALAGTIDEARMIALNGAAELQGRSFADIAAGFVEGAGGGRGEPTERSDQAGQAERGGIWQALFADDFWRLAGQHLMLVIVSVAGATLIGVPGGVAGALFPRFGAVLLAAVGALQTIPSLALLALLISAIGAIGTLPALIALFAYALLPIVRNTCVGVAQIPVGIRDAAAALGIGLLSRIRHIDLPMALPVILAGIRTAAVINVGTATIAAFIGAGGFGERIATGLALNDHRLLLAGALPAAALALLVEGGFALLERRASRYRGG